MKPNRNNRLLLAASALALLVNQATAGTTWNGNFANSGNWDAGANWEGVLPTFSATTDLLFRATSTNNRTVGQIQSDRTVRSLTFNGTVTTGFEIRLNVVNNNAAKNLTMGDGSNAAAITVNSGAAGNITIGKGGAAATGNLILANNLAVAQNSTSATLIIDAPITESGGARTLTKTGTGTLKLSGANTYTGTTTIQNGTLALDGAANRLAVAGAVVLGDTGTAGKLVLGGTTTASQTLTALTTTGSGGSVVGGNAANSTLTLNIASSNTFAGTLGGAGTNENLLALAKTGAGTLTLSNEANTFTGQVLSDSGTIQVTKLENNGTASSVGAGTGSLRLGSDATATLEYIGTSDSSTDKVIQIGTNAATNTGNATILNNSTTGKLTFTAATFNAAPSVTVARALTLGGTYTGAANEIQGIIRNNNTAGGGLVSLSKTGASTWTLSGVNTYTGATSVTGGVLAVNGSLANTSTTVGSGGTLQGSGSIAGSVTVQSGGTLATGNSIESLTTGALSLQAASTFAYEINNDALAGVAGDLTAVTGNLTLSLDNLSLLTISELGSGSWSIGDKLTLISYSGAWNDGLFSYNSSTLADDSTINFSSMEWLFNYNDTAAGTNYTGDLTGTRYVTMTAIPEPNVAALLGGLGTLLLLRRRR
jgi:autotransporter-associated beta strand protein